MNVNHQQVVVPNKRRSGKQSLLKSVFISALSASALMLLHLPLAWSLGGAVYSGPIPNAGVKGGYVMSRSVVINPETGQPIWVEFDESGDEIQTVDTGDYQALDLHVYPAPDYRFHQQTLEHYLEQYEDSLAKGAELLNKKEFEQATFLMADNETKITQEPLPDHINSVLVMAQNRRVVAVEDSTKAPNDLLVLLRFDVDLTQEVEITEEDKTLLLDNDGQVIAQSTNTIGYRVGFFGDPNEAQNERASRVGPDDTVFGPIPFAKVFVDEHAYRAGVDVSNDDGKYSFLFFMPPCPVGGFTFTTDVWAELRYRNFLPTGAPSIPYYLRTPGYTSCFASLVPPLLAPTVAAIQATTATPIVQSNLYADVMFVSGNIVLRNPKGESVGIGDTTYTTFEELPDQTTQNFYDFNGDGEDDYVAQGRILSCTLDEDDTEQKDVFARDEEFQERLDVLEGYTCEDTNTEPKLKADDKGTWQGIFFDGSQDDIEDFPDLVRLIDREFRNEPMGVLKEISEDDLRNTDILFFRESTGQLILERRGLKEEEADYRPSIEYDEDEKLVAFRVMLRGADDSRLNIGGGVRRSQSFEEWATEYQLTEPFQKRESDHPRPGEYLKVVAINRATGYTGTARVQLTGASENRLLSGLLDVEVPAITLVPPNLKIWAERDYTVEEGLTKGEDRNYTIGNEGASLVSDTSIRVYTEWLDEQGRPLPEELGLDEGAQYGLTGRLAKVVGNNQLKGDGTSSDLAEFPIGPGRNTQALRLKGLAKGTEHFYIHVIGKPKDQECVNQSSCPDFEVDSNQAELAGRPHLLTPFLTPLWNEDEQWKEYRSYREILEELEADLEEGEELAEEDRPVKPLPSYAWQIRPEYQFTQFDLEMQGIERTYRDAEDNEDTVDILNAENPTIASSDDYVEALYSLISSDFDSLKPIDGAQELVLALGEQEQRVTIGEDQTVRFEDVESLAQLDAEDFLSMRLYSNNDAGNVLWEYAFEYLAVDTLQDLDGRVDDEDEDAIIISADDPELDLQAIVLGYASRDPDRKEELVLRWRVVGDGGISPSVQRDSDDGIFNTKLTMPTDADSIGTISAYLNEDTQAVFSRVKVRPGVPDDIEIRIDGEVHAGGVDTTVADITIRDQHDNLVADGTSVNVSVDGSAVIPNNQFFTVNGRIQVEIQGGEFAGGENTLFVESGDAITEEKFEVKPLAISANFVSARQIVGQLSQVRVRLTDSTGSPVSGMSISAHSNYGAVTNPGAVSDGNGELTLSILNPGSPRQATLFMRAGFAAHEQLSYSVELQSTTDNYIDTNQALVVGDKTEDGLLSYFNDSGESNQIDYPATGFITIKGDPSTQQTVALGDISDPNIEPVASFLMNRVEDDAVFDAEIVPNETSGNDAYIVPFIVENDQGGFDEQNARLVRDSRSGAGLSLQIDKDAFLEVVRIRQIEVKESLGFRVDIKPEGPGEIFRHGESQNLSVTDTGRIRYTLWTSDSNYTLESDEAIDFGSWTTVSGRYHDGALELRIDDRPIIMTASGLIRNGGDPLIIGENYQGLIGAIKFFDWTKAPLLSFSDTQQTDELVVDLDENGLATLPIHSTGALSSEGNDDALSSPSLVAVVAGNTKSFASVISTSTYIELGRYYVEYIRDGTSLAGQPQIINASYAELAVNALTPSAQAGLFSDVVSWVWEGVNWIIPLEDIGILTTQLYYLATGDPNFSATELALSAVGTLTLIPLAKPLKVFLGPLRNIIRIAPPKFVTSFGGAVGRRVEKAIDSRSFDAIITILPIAIIIGELALDSEAREGLLFMLNTIKSEEDFLVWADYLSLPADGWEGDTVPEVEIGAVEHQTGNQFDFSSIALSLIAEDSVARSRTRNKKKKKPSRISGARIAKLMTSLKRFDGSALGARAVISGVRGVTRTMRTTDIADLRKTVFNRNTLNMSVAVGSNALKRLYRKLDNLRIPPYAIAGLIWYLESRRTCEGIEGTCKTLSADISTKLETEIYSKLFTEAFLVGNKDFVGGFENGAAFHLAVLAYYHLKHEQSEVFRKPLDIERLQNVHLYKSLKTDNTLTKKPFQRRVDIILESDKPGDETWIETKSFKRPVDPRRFSTWNLARGKQLKDTTEKGASKVPHKQFFLDRVATLTQKKTRSLGGDMKWWFHEFKRAGFKSFNKNDMEKVENLLLKLPSMGGSSKLPLASLGVRSKIELPSLSSKLDVFSVKNVILEDFRDILFSELSEVDYNNLIINSAHDLTVQ